MREDRFRIGVFIDSQSMGATLRRAELERNVEFLINLSQLEASLPMGKKMEESGVDVVIARAGMAFLLRENLTIPVLSFPMTTFDTLWSLKKAKSHGNRIAFPSFRTKLRDIELAEELLGITTVQTVYHDTPSLRRAIVEAAAQEASVVVGGPVTLKIAHELGFTAVSYETSEQSVMSAVDDAISVVRSYREERAKTHFYQSIIDSASEAIIAVDEHGKIRAINQMARSFLSISSTNTEGVHIGKYLKHSPLEEVLGSQEPILDNLERVQNELFIFNHVPVTMGQKFLGVVSTFKDRSTVVSAENKVRRSLSKGHVAKYTLDNLIFRSPLMKHITSQAKQFAKVDSPIMITGETGTGKEILSQSIHNLSPRRKKPFVSINCAALPEQLLESELFGYEEGAFTGSRKGGKSGLFELAHEGTIFLDEISATSTRFQSQLLRVIQEKEVMRVGSDRLIPLDVRLIAAANKRLSEEVQRGTFRQDLFFRLNVLYIEIPPLRKRVEDIPVLLDHFVTTISKEHDLEPLTLARVYVERLMEYAWPGNVRQLRNFAERLVLLCGSRFDEEVLEEAYVELIESLPAPDISTPVHSARNYTLREQLDLEKRQTGRRIIEKALEEAHFSRSKACEILGISRTTLWKEMKELGIE